MSGGRIIELKGRNNPRAPASFKWAAFHRVECFLKCAHPQHQPAFPFGPPKLSHAPLVPQLLPVVWRSTSICSLSSLHHGFKTMETCFGKQTERCGIGSELQQLGVHSNYLWGVPGLGTKEQMHCFSQPTWQRTLPTALTREQQCADAYSPALPTRLPSAPCNISCH